MSKHINNPALYRKLEEPVESAEVATKMGQEFYDELSALREKYHVVEFVVAFGINAKTPDGKEQLVLQTGYRGGQRTDSLILELVKQTRFGQSLLGLIDELNIVCF